MTPEEEAYNLAEERIAEAKEGGWEYLVLGTDTQEFEHGDEVRTGSEKLKHLTTIPPQIADLTNLERLDVDFTQVSDLTPIQGLTGLQKLYLSSTKVSEFTPIQRLTGLQTLDLSNTRFSGLAPIQPLTGLQRLFLNSTQISDLTPIKGLIGLQTLGLDNTQISDLTPIEGLIGLQELSLSHTKVSDLTPIQGLTWLLMLYLGNTQVSDLMPIQALTGLQRLYLDGTPLLENEPALREISKEYQGAELVQKILEWQRDNGKLPPQGRTEHPLTIEDLPEQVEDLAVVESDGKIEVKPGVLSPDEQDDPLRSKLHQRLRAKVRELAPFGNQFYRLDPKIRRLNAALDCPFEDLDPVDVWLELEELRIDLARNNAKREEPYSEELLAVLESTLTVGGALVIGMKDIDALEARSDVIREVSTPNEQTSAEDVAQQILDDPTPWGERLRAYLGITKGLSAEESRRFLGVRLTLIRNALIGAGGYFLANFTDTAVGGLSQTIIEWVAANAAVLKPYALSLSEGSGAWLVRFVNMAQEITGAAVSVGQPPRPVNDDDQS